MNRKLLAGAFAGAAAVSLVVVGATYSEPVSSAQVPHNAVGAGVLQLDLHSDGADARLTFRGLMPGDTNRQRFWIAANDVSSTVAGALAVRFDRVIDTPAPCGVSRGKALGEIASGIGGCTVSGDQVSGTPRQGNVSRLLAVRIGYVSSAGDAESCTADAGERSLLADNRPGNLRRVGRHLYLLEDGTAPLVLFPGHGACLAVTAAWPPGTTRAGSADPDRPVDDAAQGDTLQVQVHFQLTQVAS